MPVRSQKVAKQLDVERIVLDDQDLGQVASFKKSADSFYSVRTQTHNDSDALALAALAETLRDERRARRFLDLTGIGTEELRARVGEPSLLAGLLRFLEAHEPDLLFVAQKLGVTPDLLVQARRDLEAKGRQ